MSELRFIAVDSTAAQGIRDSRVDALGNDAVVRTANEPNAYPCRHCLQDAAAGTDLLLVTYSPFPARGVYSEIGPIFLCDEDCTKFVGGNGTPPIVRHRHIGLRVYDKHDMMMYEHNALLQGVEAESALNKIFTDPKVEKVHIRTALNGCFLCEVRRV